MKNTGNSDKNTSLINTGIKKAAEIGKSTASSMREKLKSISEKAKINKHAHDMKKYNPIFPEDYQSEDFKMPNLIVIVDDAIRRDIEVCNGAIGWLQTSDSSEILYLYDEAIEFSGINFIPNAACDTVYYVDNFDRNRFTKLDCIFSKAHEERLAELERIAYSLGAISCSIELVESQSSSVDNKKTMKSGSKNSVSESYTNSSETKFSGKTVCNFEGNSTPRRPQLKWFAHDDSILGLIEMRCNGNNSIKSRSLELNGSSCATMSQTAAYQIDCAIKKVNLKASVNMENQAQKEMRSKLIFCLEF